MAVTKYRDEWYVDVGVNVPGKGRQRIRRRSPVQTKKGAVAYERVLIEDALSTSKHCEPRKFDSYAVEFLETYAATNNKFSSVVSKESILRVHLVPAFGNLELADIGRREIEFYKAEKLRSGLKPKSINNHLTVLRRMLDEAVQREYIEQLPRFTWLKTEPPKFFFLDFEQAERLIEAADDDWMVMITLALRTGLRIGELLALQWGDFDLKSGRVLVQRAIAREQLGTPKSGRTREIPLSQDTTAVLRR
ncbi:MAG: site-specific integrase, partial [Myxococcota bacterium]